MSETTITRRSALMTGTLSAIGIGLMAAAGATTAPHVAAQPAPTIEDAERLIVELAGILIHLDERDASNVGHVLDQLGRAAGSSAHHLAEAVADALSDIGPGNRVHDQMDREIAAARQAAVTHAAVVETYAGRHDARHTGESSMAIRSELVGAYGDELGEAIAEAAFRLHLHDRHGHTGAPADCWGCWEH